MCDFEFAFFFYIEFDSNILNQNLLNFVKGLLDSVGIIQDFVMGGFRCQSGDLTR